VPKFGMKVPILDVTHTRVSRSNGQRSGLEAAEPSGHTACLLLISVVYVAVAME